VVAGELVHPLPFVIVVQGILELVAEPVLFHVTQEEVLSQFEEEGASKTCL